MTVHAEQLGAKAGRLRIALGADALAVAGLAVLWVALTALVWNTWGDLDSDTGYDVVAGGLVADGRLPYIDFVYYYGPLAPLLAGLVSAVAGPGIGTIVALGFAITALIVAATYALARTFVGPLGAFLAAGAHDRGRVLRRTTTPTSCRTRSRPRSGRSSCSRSCSACGSSGAARRSCGRRWPERRSACSR